MAVVNLILGDGGVYYPPNAQDVLLIFGGTLISQPGNIVPSSLRAPWNRAASAGTGSVGLAWGVAGTAGAGGVEIPWGRNDSVLSTDTDVSWKRPIPIQNQTQAPWSRALPTYQFARMPWERATPEFNQTELVWGKAARNDIEILAPWQAGKPEFIYALMPWGRANRIIAPNKPWRKPPAPAPIPKPSSWIRLHFCVPLADDRLNLVLGVNPCDGILPPAFGTVVHPRSVFMQVHVCTAFVLPDLTEEVPILSFSLSADYQAYGWTLTANCHVSVMDQLAPVDGLPARLRVTIDGLDFDFVVRGLRRTRAFNGFSATVTASSSSALLAAPYSPQRNFMNAYDATAQQIVNDALEFTDVGLDWRLTDWFVPAGVWSFTGTSLGAAQAVAAAAGAIVQSPRTGDNIIIAPKYPALPRDWAATDPDVIFESLDAFISEGYERADQPDYEGVYISGQTQGVLTLVKYTGTAPSLYLPLITDRLITHVDAARQRGIGELGGAGPQATMTISCPVLTGVGEPGIIDVGKLIRVDDPAGTWFGLVRSVSVNVKMPTIVQTLTIERHL